LDKIDTKMIQLGLYVHEYKNRIKKLLLWSAIEILFRNHLAEI
jgi:hypothetical protein